MELKVLRSMWGAPRNYDAAIAETVGLGFDGIEGPLPEDPAARRSLRAMLDEHALVWTQEVTTGLRPGNTQDWWVPAAACTVDDHLADLRRGAEIGRDFGVPFVTTMCGYDAWSWGQNRDFFGRALELERELGVTILFETHRCRSLFNPWITRDLLREYPAMRLTCDFSHWCVVAERIIDTELDIIKLCAERAGHVHGRVGYAQGAQVADPREPRFERALRAHEAWWDLVWASQEARGLAVSTMNIEWGPDGYTPHLPFTDMAMVDRMGIVKWMGDRQRRRFAGRGEVVTADARG